MDKPKRLTKLEKYWEDYTGTVEFNEQDSGNWCVYISGFFADFELAEITKALKAANKAGAL